jgi:hypothetical protein
MRKYSSEFETFLKYFLFDLNIGLNIREPAGKQTHGCQKL